MSALMRLPGLMPYLLVVFLNAFVDLGHKILIQNTIFKVHDGPTQVALTAVVNALILLPFILLFSPSGMAADRFPKNRVMRGAALVAVGLTLAITACYYLGWFWPAFAMTFLLAVQSAFYSPAKYGYIKELVGKERLGEGNAVVQAVTIVSILAGTFAFSILFESLFQGQTREADIVRAMAPLGWILVGLSLVEYWMARRLPEFPAPAPETRLHWQDYVRGRALAHNIQPAWRAPVIRLSIIGLSVFWAVSQVMLAAFPAFAKDHLAVTNTIVIQGVLAASGLGIVTGSVLAGRWSRHHIETGLIPVGALGIAVGLLLLPQLDSVGAEALMFYFIGVMGGLFIVPLNALIQFNAAERDLGRVLAANNLIQNIAMLGFLAVTAGAALAGLSPLWLLFLVAAVAFVGGAYTVAKLPQSLVRFILTYVMSRRYRVCVQGLNNLPEEGGVLLLGNHISWIDWAVVQVASPRPVRFVMLKSIYQRWYLNWFFRLFGVVPIAQGPGAEASLNRVAELLDAGEVVCLFPEGSISRTGHLVEFRRGYERALAKVTGSAVIVPFYLRGLWGSQFSRSSERLKNVRSRGLTRDLILAFGTALPKDTGVDVLKRRVFDLSVRSWQEYVEQLPSVPAAWLRAVKRQGSEMSVADSVSGALSGTKLLALVSLLRRCIRRQSAERNVGLLLPAGVAGAAANMAVLAAGKTVVNLNYSASREALTAAVEQAGIRQVYTSRIFVRRLKARGLDMAERLPGVELIELETLREGFSRRDQLRAWLGAKLVPVWFRKWWWCRHIDPAATAAILFSSGSEGKPKGVCLSHRNLMANIRQVSDVLNMRDDDVVLGSLPLFHAFGLSVTTLMPLVEGLPLACHADPTDALGIAKTASTYRTTVMCATATFLRLFCANRKVHPLMLDSLRVVVAGAEKLPDDVRHAFALKFNKPVLEGYGATETTPVASVNLPDALDTRYWQVQSGSKAGSVGMPLPGTSFKIVDPQSFDELPTGEAGMVLIGGAQVMQGYLNDPQRTSRVIREIDGLRWYVTGDKGVLDADGFLTIIDRYSRFAKLGGEMVSLGAVESAARTALDDPERELVAVALPDPRKGERVVLLVEGEVDAAAFRQAMQANGANPLMLPAAVYRVAGIPKLGSGKNDYPAARFLAEQAETVPMPG